jgi:pimeloyl-ACP methyl ester carboxylesterase
MPLTSVYAVRGRFPGHWTVASAVRYGFNLGKVLARGISTGGYYALRVAHTHAERLSAVVAQGSGCHHMFDPGWIHAQNQMEYPFALADAIAYKFGYRETDSAAAVTRYATEARKFSLADTGVLATPACKLLVINGMEDSIFPIEDSIIAATQGRNKDLVALGDRGHMGDPDAEDVLHEWLDKAAADQP